MKKIELLIPESRKGWLLFPIRGKEDLITQLMRTIMIVVNNESSHLPDEKGVKVSIVIKEKISRIFYEYDQKIVSFNFPFMLKRKEGQEESYEIYDNVAGVINNEIISDILTLINNKKCLEKSCAYGFLEDIDELLSKPQIDFNYWDLIKNLLTFEEGYVRYDLDSERADGQIHPENHLDIFYTNPNSFKLGLLQEIQLDYFLDILDITTPIHYVTSQG